MAPPAALPPSASLVNSSKGALIVTELIANDLPSIDQPIAVSLQVAGATVRSGPPCARHRNGNSFRFDTPLQVNAPLATLYKSKAVLMLEYPNPNDNLTATMDCKKLCIQDTSSMTLDLGHVVPPEVTMSSITTARSDDSAVTTHARPSLTLQVRLEGPMRTEITALLNLLRAWFHVVDTAEDALAPLLQNLPSAEYLSLLLIPSVPLVTGALVVSPILVGLFILFLPIMLPLCILVGIFMVFWASAGGIVLASTRAGRSKIATTCAPLYQTLLSQPPAQVMLYDTGARPTPVTCAQSYLPTDLLGKLCISLLMDGLGSSSYLLPGLGESFDVVWCPCQTILIKAMYGSVSPNLTYVSFAEEFLPFTDVLPSATIGWASEFGPSLLKMAKEQVMNSGGKSSSGGSIRAHLVARDGVRGSNVRVAQQ